MSIPKENYTVDQLWELIYKLREEIKGPGKFLTWKDAALAERLYRMSLEEDALRYRFIRDSDMFGEETEDGTLSSWDDLSWLGYGDFDDAIDARINHPNINYREFDIKLRKHLPEYKNLFGEGDD